VTDPAWCFLAPDLDLPETRVLKALASRAHLPFPGVAQTLADTHDLFRARLVVSVGKAGIAEWHRFGLVTVSGGHGRLFTHHDPAARYPTLTIMQLQHPGTAMQMSLGGYDAKADIGHDLTRWRELIGHLGTKRFVALKKQMRMTSCAKCQASRKVTTRPATNWLVGADGVGLCDDHWRRRGQIRAKRPPTERNRSKPEAQVPGQLEAWG